MSACAPIFFQKSPEFSVRRHLAYNVITIPTQAITAGPPKTTVATSGECIIAI
jgi:hypothetical protein